MMRFLSCKVVQSYVNIDTLLVSTLFLLQEKTFAGTNVKPFLGAGWAATYPENVLGGGLLIRKKRILNLCMFNVCNHPPNQEGH